MNTAIEDAFLRPAERVFMSQIQERTYANLSPLWQDVVQFHGQEASLHAIVDGIALMQARADADYFLRCAGRAFSAAEQDAIHDMMRRAYQSFTSPITETDMNLAIETRSPALDLAAIKQRQQATWASGDFAVVGTTLQIVGESLAEAADVRADERVLDVAAGNGNATLAAARRFARVTSTDYVPTLLDKGRLRAEAEALPVQFEVADVENLPYADGSFDVVLSTFGAMFVPDHRRTASEMMRVLRSGGRLGMANWTPDNFIGRLFKVIGAHLPPPAGLQSPALWGTEKHVAQLFGAQAADIQCDLRHFNFRYRSAAHWLQVFRDYYGPTHKAFAALDQAGQQSLARAITALLDEMNVAGPASLVVPSAYLEIVITKR